MGRPVETVDGKATRSFQNWRHQLLGFAAFVGCVLTGGISQAQQNLFNVPSAEITDAYTMFFGPSGIFMGEAVTHRSRSR